MELFTRTLSDFSSQKYLLKILEIPGKSVTQKYIDVIKDKLDNLDLKYSFDIVLDENLIDNLNNTNGVQSGGASTYPYNMFESMVDNLIRREQSDKNWITTSREKLEEYKTKQQGYIDKFFSYKPLDDVKEVTFETNETTGQESSIGEPSVEFIEEHKKTTIDIPSNFAGVLHIQVTIYKPSNGLVLGLRELNQIE